MHRYAHINRIQARQRQGARVAVRAKAQTFRELLSKMESGDLYTARTRLRDAHAAGMRVVDVVRFECEHDNGSTETAYRDFLIGEATSVSYGAGDLQDDTNRPGADRASNW